MRLVEVQESSLKSKHYDESNVPSKLSIRTAEQARKTMMTSFAGKAANRNLERKERMRINVDIVKGQLDKTMNDTLPSALPEKDDFDISMAEREEQQKAMLPKMNAAASKIDEIYELTDLISMDLLNRLESDAIEVLKTERTELPITSEYLLDIIESCQKSKEPDSANNLRIVKVCIYVDALISFQKKLRGVSKQGVGSFSDITDKVEVDIRHNFTQPATHKMWASHILTIYWHDTKPYLSLFSSKTDYIIHKVIAYALILSLLIVEKHEMSVTSLVTALNIPKTKLMLITTVLPVRTTANGQTIGLKLPSKLRLGGFVRKRRA